MILSGLGGKDNISDLDCCATRLRITVHNPQTVSEAILKQSGAAGVIKKGNGIQVIYGPKVTVIKSDLEDYIKNIKDDKATTANQKISTTDVYAPLEGKVIPLKEINDEAFSSGMLGNGIGIIPKDGKVYAPVSGKIDNISDSKHAIGIKSDNGEDILIHIGIDTVKLNGEPFKILVKENEVVRKGQLICEADIEKIKKSGFDTTTPVLICSGEKIKDIKYGDVTKDTVILKTEK